MNDQAQPPSSPRSPLVADRPTPDAAAVARDDAFYIRELKNVNPDEPAYVEGRRVAIRVTGCGCYCEPGMSLCHVCGGAIDIRDALRTAEQRGQERGRAAERERIAAAFEAGCTQTQLNEAKPGIFRRPGPCGECVHCRTGTQVRGDREASAGEGGDG